ncbi:MAG TPA: MoaD/ThiS family protein [Rectinemataceae bacterium]|nr:MoaD/ThiS family protein [Rectinemataceae bacterium]
MRVTLRLFASLRTGRFDEAEFELPPAATVGEALDAAGVPRLEAAIVFVDGRHADFDHPLAEGDSLGVFPPIGGG